MERVQFVTKSQAIVEPGRPDSAMRALVWRKIFTEQGLPTISNV
jgi:hypothetical protein